MTAEKRVPPAATLDGRWILCAAAVVAYCLLLVAPGHPQLQGWWKAYGVDHLAPPFIDLRSLTTAADAVREGGDPLWSNRRDPLARANNYPRVWLALAHAGLSEVHTVPVGYCIIGGFLIAVLWVVRRLTLPEGIFYSLLVCSPAAVLAVERANTDLLLFILLAVATALVTSRRFHWWAYVFIFFCAVLKLFPIFGFALAMRERLRTGVIVLLAAGTAFAAYLWLSRDDVKAIASNTPQGVYVSYGRKVVFERLRDYGIPLDPNLWSLLFISIVLVGAVLACTLVRIPEFSPGAMEKMFVGAAIYCGSFALLNSFNYRLIFLLLLIPQLLRWRKVAPSWRWAATAALAIIALAMCLSAQLRSWLFLLKESANWMIFSFATYLLLQSALRWFSAKPFGDAAPQLAS